MYRFSDSVIFGDFLPSEWLGTFQREISTWGQFWSHLSSVWTFLAVEEWMVIMIVHGITVTMRFWMKARHQSLFDYTIAMKLQAAEGWRSRSWLSPWPASPFQSTHWVSMEYELQYWMNGPQSLRPVNPNHLFTRHPPRIRLFLWEKRGASWTME